MTSNFCWYCNQRYVKYALFADNREFSVKLYLPDGIFTIHDCYHVIFESCRIIFSLADAERFFSYRFSSRLSCFVGNVRRETPSEKSGGQRSRGARFGCCTSSEIMRITTNDYHLCLSDRSLLRVTSLRVSLSLPLFLSLRVANRREPPQSVFASIFRRCIAPAHSN